MKADHYKKLKDKYFQGETSTEEEQFLKSESIDSIFEFFKEEREEKMNWDFDNFLDEVSKQQESAKHIPISNVKPEKKKTNFVWLAAASVLLLFGLYFGYTENTKMDSVDTQLANEIQKQRKEFFEENQLAANTSAPDSVTASKDSIRVENPASTNSIDEKKLMDQILSKKGRIKKINRERYAQNENSTHNQPSQKVRYEETYVTVNGEKIKDPQEAIDITKYSVQLLADKMSKSITSTLTQENTLE